MLAYSHTMASQAPHAAKAGLSCSISMLYTWAKPQAWKTQPAKINNSQPVLSIELSRYPSTPCHFASVWIIIPLLYHNDNYWLI